MTLEQFYYLQMLLPKFLVRVLSTVNVRHVVLGQFECFGFGFRLDDEPAVRCCRLTIELVCICRGVSVCLPGRDATTGEIMEASGGIPAAYDCLAKGETQSPVASG